MSRIDTHPIAYAAGEAIASKTQIALIVWEVPGGIEYRTVPAVSRVVLSGMLAVLAEAVDAQQAYVPEDDEEGAED